MKTRFLTILMILLAGAGNLFSQVAINNDGALPNSSAMLDIKSDTAGVLIPRMTAVQRDAINNPAQGLMVYVTDDNTFYYFDSSSWQAIGNGSSGSSYWNLNGTTVSADSLYSVAIGTKNTSGNFEVSTDVGSGTYTADLCSGGVVSAQEYQNPYVPDHLFDNDNVSIWRNNNTLPVWIQYDFGAGNEKKIQKYRLLWQGAIFDFTPYSWDFLASNDETTWTTVDSQTGQAVWSSGEWKEFVFSNQQAYRYYRLQITDNNGVGNTGVYLNEMEMMEEVYAQYPAFYVSSDKVGIGTQSPTANLQVDGSFKYVDGNEGNGKILSSDADGNAIWSDAVSLGLTDADFFAEGTSLPPSDINDDMYTMGNVAIGKNLANYPIDIHSDSAGRGVSVYLNENRNNSMGGLYNDLTNAGTGPQFGVANNLSGSSGGEQYGTINTITNSGTGIHYGVQNILSGANNGVHFGVYNFLSGNGQGKQYGVKNDIFNGNDNEQFGEYNVIYGNGNGTHFGSYNELSGSGGGMQIGVYDSIYNTGNANHYGIKSILNGSGSGNHYGAFNKLSGMGNGDKYGTYNLIESNAGGTHYAVYGEAEKTGSYAGYFKGDVEVTQKLKAPDSGEADMKAYVYGSVCFDGDICYGTSSGGFNVYHISDGQYTIDFTNGPLYEYTVVATPRADYPLFISIDRDLNLLEIYIWDINGNPVDARFQFVVFKP